MIRMPTGIACARARPALVGRIAAQDAGCVGRAVCPLVRLHAIHAPAARDASGGQDPRRAAGTGSLRALSRKTSRRRHAAPGCPYDARCNPRCRKTRPYAHRDSTPPCTALMPRMKTNRLLAPRIDADNPHHAPRLRFGPFTLPIDTPRSMNHPATVSSLASRKATPAPCHARPAPAAKRSSTSSNATASNACSAFPACIPSSSIAASPRRRSAT